MTLRKHRLLLLGYQIYGILQTSHLSYIFIKHKPNLVSAGKKVKQIAEVSVPIINACVSKMFKFIVIMLKHLRKRKVNLEKEQP